ncbi:MAG: cysteine desulfurase [Ilumatobacter sp.]|nr:cysteine desulfurase [Ilumatobacter sp.]
MAITYLDHAASTPMRERAIASMVPYFGEMYANPSGSHRFARAARQAIDEARDDVADVLGVAPGSVIFTSCGTEADNTVLAGVSGGAVCSAAEHHAVLHPIEHRGDGVVVGTDAFGRIDLDRLADACADPSVGVVSVMTVNNEVGAISDMAAVAAVVREVAPQAVLHTDAVQAPCWVDVRDIAPLVDAMSFSAHKFGGPKGVGVLTLAPGVAVDPLIVGGGQERERRSGTHNVAGIVGLATALVETDRDRDGELQRIAALRDRLVDALVGSIDGVVETVPRDHKVAGSAHVCISGVENEALLFLLDEADVCASAASACASGAMEPSHVLAAMGVDRELALGALRLTLGHTTTESDVDRAADVVVDAVGRLRRGVS